MQASSNTLPTHQSLRRAWIIPVLGLPQVPRLALLASLAGQRNGKEFQHTRAAVPAPSQPPVPGNTR